ncbi:MULTISPECIES: DUF2059 domain-containing protein [unclassified Maridesulfovibrio]|uniref:DUF2059 domain-containing protein n=1 Tax=unclassified Maridesulfovibrio TaxID=2794999 RepID=UPI003B40983E
MKKIKLSIVCILALLCLTAQPVKADETEKQEVALELVRESVNMQAMYAVFDYIAMTAIKNDINNDPETEGHRIPLIAAHQQAVKEAFYDPKILGGLQSLQADIYAKEFNKAELEGLLRFYKTPLGKKYMKKQQIIARAGEKEAAELLGPVFIETMNNKLTPIIEALRNDGIIPTEE